MKDMKRHSGRVALITGSSEGIGRAVAIQLAKDGAAVGVHGLVQDGVDAVVREITDIGGRATGFCGDVSEHETHVNFVKHTLEAFGRIDHIVTSAGIQAYGDSLSTTPEEFDRVFSINVRGVFLAIHEAISEIRRNQGTVTLISSVQGIATQNNVLAYTASKGALNAMTRALAVDEAEFGVRVNAVLPGSVDTPMLRRSAAEWSDGTPEGVDQVLSDWGQVHALRRIAQPHEIGAVCSFLASDEASFITGAEIRVDGGLLSRIAASLPSKED
jgi:NAD(P)-dependent dehydrogenase (short-subunit alcohol dehydrogenase family)